tara:strand:- start:33 stop:434 length:402 start_codon:yes stop_codon:yes gene_type:complete
MSPTEHICSFCNEIGGEYIGLDGIDDYDDDEQIENNGWDLDSDRNMKWFNGYIPEERMREVIQIYKKYPNLSQFCGYCDEQGYIKMSVSKYEELTDRIADLEKQVAEKAVKPPPKYKRITLEQYAEYQKLIVG